VYLLVAIIIGFLLLFSFKTINKLTDKTLDHQMILLQEELRQDITAQALHLDSIIEGEYNIPGKITKACFIDLKRKEDIIEEGHFEKYPIVLDSIQTTKNNLFLIDNEENYYSSYYVGDVTVLNDYKCKPASCFDVTNGILKIMMMGRGGSTLILPEDGIKEKMVKCECPAGCKIKPDAAFTTEGNMERLPITFNARGSKDIDNRIINYEWDFGDGENTTQLTAETIHRYLSPGEYTIRLIVEDETGLKGESVKSINILPYQLRAVIKIISEPVRVGEEITFDGGDSLGVIRYYNWYIDEGISNRPIVEEQGKTINHTYIQSGTKTLKLEIEDLYGSTDIQIITVEVLPP
jgi:hypothetical protein